MSLFPAFLGDVYDVAQIQRKLCVRCALFDALIALEKGRERDAVIKKNTFLWFYNRTFEM